jgi:hypothetical protein
MSKGEERMSALHTSPVRRANRHERVQRRRASWLTCLAILAAALLGCGLPQAAPAAEVKYSATPLRTEPWTPCPPATANNAECEVIVAPRPSTAAGIPEYEGSGELGGLDPKDLRSAYKLPEKGGSTQTIAIVDAYNDPNAESDLAVYRNHYGLSACTEANGCFKKVNASGETKNYPTNDVGWSVEISLDLDMVSAACGECHILLVEATDGEHKSFGAAEEEAVKLGASVVSNSWNFGFEGTEPKEVHATEETEYDKYFNHPGVPIFFSGGDYGYAVRYPAVSQYVVAVGGTRLKKESKVSRGWEEEVWSNPAYGFRQKGRGTGSGCSKYETKPKWQTDKACSKRIETDVSAVADWEKSPVSLYDSYELPGWETNGGTSASSPFVAGVEGLSTEYTRALGADAFYISGPMGQLFDVTKGNNGTCTPPAEDEYWCTAEVGYDGPTGWGTPNGVPVLGVWTVKSTENPSSESDRMSGVSCTSSSACTGVGNYKFGSNTLAERWNGTSWTQQSTPTPAKTESSLWGVSCTSSTACTAVGLSVNTTSGPAVVTLAESWNGTEWTVKKTPNPSGALESRLFAVSCSSSTACTAVGEYVSSAGKELPLAEIWNGTEWSIQKPPSPSEAEGSELTEVSCTSSTACAAVGHYSTKTGYPVSLAESWNGTEWSIKKTLLPEGTVGSHLSGVSCSSSSACTAVGSYETSARVAMTLAEGWNGTEWSIQKTPNPAGGAESDLSGVSCSSSTTCTAVGSYQNSSGTEVTLAEGWNGVEWLIQEAANPAESKASSLAGVACVSAIACSTVGTYTGHSGQATLAESGPE